MGAHDCYSILDQNLERAESFAMAGGEGPGEETRLSAPEGQPDFEVTQPASTSQSGILCQTVELVSVTQITFLFVFCKTFHRHYVRKARGPRFCLDC